MPFFGICLGMQALFETQRRGAGRARPGHLPRHGAALSGGCAGAAHGLERTRTPAPGAQLIRTFRRRPYVYFAHSYYVPAIPQASATCTYELPYTAALEAGNVYGVQFHPEKSGAVGLAIVRNFVNLPC